MGFGARLKKVMDFLEIKAPQLAKETGIPVQTIYSIINKDINNVSVERVAKIEKALDAMPGTNLNKALHSDDVYLIPDIDDQLKKEKEERKILRKYRTPTDTAISDVLDTNNATTRLILEAIRNIRARYSNDIDNFYDQLDTKGRAKLLEYAADLVALQQYREQAATDPTDDHTKEG